jgi:hypothetical protein
MYYFCFTLYDFIMKKSEFLLKISKLNEPTLHYCPNAGTLTQSCFTIKVSRRYEDWGEGQYFFTNEVVYRKYSNDDYMKYLERIEKFKKKINRWFDEYINSKQK